MVWEKTGLPMGRWVNAEVWWLKAEGPQWHHRFHMLLLGKRVPVSSSGKIAVTMAGPLGARGWQGRGKGSGAGGLSPARRKEEWGKEGAGSHGHALRAVVGSRGCFITQMEAGTGALSGCVWVGGAPFLGLPKLPSLPAQGHLGAGRARQCRQQQGPRRQPGCPRGHRVGRAEGRAPGGPPEEHRE